MKKKTRRIKDIISKPSEAIDAMINGLLKQDARKDFIVNMHTYGRTVKLDPPNCLNSVCFGCAAACCIQEITSVNYTPKHEIGITRIRASLSGIDENDLAEFEGVIESLRHGSIYSLFEYFGIKELYNNEKILSFEKHLLVLGNDCWKEGLEPYKKCSAYLKTRGL